MNENIPLYPLSINNFYPHYSSDEIYTQQRVNGYTPRQLYTAYGFDERSLDAKDMKIAVICAFDNVALRFNTETFCREFSLPVPEISVYYPDGRADITTQSWITESSLDVQWISAFAQGAEIMCIFAKDAQTENMLSAVSFAKTLNPDVISMSFGTVESGDFLEKINVFDSSGTIFVASSGNIPSVPCFPSTDVNVLSVGASELVTNEAGKRIRESVWRETGSGVSELFSIPQYQFRMQGINELTDGKRGIPDVSFCGSRSYGASVYVSSMGGWTTAGGTSLACACVAGICACIAKKHPQVKRDGVADYFYTVAGQSIYSLPQYYFYDIVLGSNGRYFAKEGWDLCSGLGSVTSKTV